MDLFFFPSESGKTINSAEFVHENSVKFGDNSVKFGESDISKTAEKILDMIKENRMISAADMADKLSISVRTVEKYIKGLREAGILIRHGAARGGYWEIMEL